MATSNDGAAYIASGFSGSTDESGEPNKKMEQMHAQVNDVVGVMRANMELVLQRDEKLSDLDARAEELENGAQQFHSSATRLKRKYWWQNVKMWIIIIIVVLVLIIIIIVWVVLSTKN